MANCLDSLKKYNGVNVIYALFTDKEGIRYIGYSKKVYERFLAHLRNSDYESNIYKKNWIDKNKKDIKIQILSVDPLDWEKEEKKYISKYKNRLLNICEGGKNNIINKPFESLTKEDHINQINKSLTELNRFLKSKGREKRFKLI